MKFWTAVATLLVSLCVASTADAAMTVKPATASQITAIQAAAQDHCGYRNASSYLFDLLVSSNGYAVGTPDARNPLDQADGLIWFRHSGGHWHYLGCGSGSLPAFVGEIERHVTQVKTEPTPSATVKIFDSLVFGYFPQAETTGVFVYTNFGWASLIINRVVGGNPSGTVVVFKRSAKGWGIFASGSLQNLLPGPQFSLSTTLRNVPFQVIGVLEHQTYIDLGDG